MDSIKVINLFEIEKFGNSKVHNNSSKLNSIDDVYKIRENLTNTGTFDSNTKVNRDLLDKAVNKLFSTVSNDVVQNNTAQAA